MTKGLEQRAVEAGLTGVAMLDGLDGACIGYGVELGRGPVLVYDQELLLGELAKHGLTQAEAAAWVRRMKRTRGPARRPLILTRWPQQEDDGDG